MEKNIKIFIVLFTILFFSCNVYNNNNITKEVFLADNSILNFNEWKGWTISYREGSNYYIAVFKDSIRNQENRLIFWKNDSVLIKLTMNNKMSSILSFNTIRDNPLWISFYDNIEIQDLYCKINFVYNYKLSLITSVENGIYFKNSNFDLFYLFKSEINPPTLYNNLKENWYIREGNDPAGPR
jgi:hypothetical protein